MNNINNNKSLFLYLGLAVIIYFLFFNNSKEHFSDSTLPVNWKQIAESQCNYLKNEIKKIDELLLSCTNKNNLDNHLLINNRMTCRDGNDMSINLSREQQHWCNSAQGLPSKDAIFMNAQGTPDKIDSHNINLSFINNKNINEYLEKNSTVVKPEDEKYKYINSIGIVGFSGDIDTRYASIQ